MAKKAKKEIKKLKKAVGELQDRNEALAEELADALEAQTEEIRDIKAALDSRPDASENPDGGATSPTEEEPEATEAAEKKAREHGVDLSGIEGSGSEGRILVSDVESAADRSG